MAEGKSRILVIGGTGYIGKFIVEASVKSGHPTYLLVRQSTTATKAELLDKFKSAGVTLLHGDIYDHESLLKAIKQVDVVISTMSNNQIPDQTKIIAAIKEGGNIKRFFPAEFGSDSDVDRTPAVDPLRSFIEIKAKIRRAIEAEGIPYTYVVSNSFAGWSLSTLGQAEATSLPTDKIIMLGDGNPKVIFVCEEDIGTYTIKAVDDPRTLNKILYIRPPANILSHNEVVSLWEKKIGKTLERVYVPEEQVLKQIQESPFPLNFRLSIYHSLLVNGVQANFEINPSFGVEATQLYPDVKYTTVEEYLSRFL